VVRTYPTPARKGIEVSCTAAIRDGGSWMRLYPVPYRLLEQNKQFKKYQWIEARVSRTSTDARPESYRLDLDSIELGRFVPSSQRWEERRKLVLPLLSHCFCCVSRERDNRGFPTLALFKPKGVFTLQIEQDTPNWTPDQRKKLEQQVPFFARAPAKELEKIPFRFYYCFECDEPTCPGHRLMCTDWEMSQAYRSWRGKYGEHWEPEVPSEIRATDALAGHSLLCRDAASVSGSVADCRSVLPSAGRIKAV
jgi:hypothetical protein